MLALNIGQHYKSDIIWEPLIVETANYYGILASNDEINFPITIHIDLVKYL